MSSGPRKGWAGLLVACTLWLPAAFAQSPLFSEVHTVATPAANRAVPVEETFSISVAGDYKVTLVDLGAQLASPAPLGSVQLAITSGNTIVGTPLTAAGTATFTAAVGDYVLHVIGTIGGAPGSGPIGIQITDSSNNQVAAFSDTLTQAATTLPSNEALLSDSFHVDTGGNFQVSLTDLNLPASLGTLTLLLIQQGGTSPILTLPDTNNGNAMQATVALQAGDYQIFALGQVAGGGVNAGLFSVAVSPSGGGAALYSSTLPIGLVSLIDTLSLNAGSYTLTATDLSVPAALTQIGAVVTLDGQPVAQVNSSTSQSFTVGAGKAQVLALATAATTTAGSYAISLQPQGGGTPLLSVARAVSSGDGTTVTGYSFDAMVAAGAYTFAVADFGFPALFKSLNAVVSQGGAVLGTPMTAAGSQTVTLTADPVSMLMFAGADTSGGLFGVDLTASGDTSPVFETTQGVGQLFSARKVSVTSAATYQVAVDDLKFPAAFASLAVVVTSGTKTVGSIYGGGTFNFSATPGNYYINFIAQPGGTDGAGTYSMTVGPPPPAPVVTLQSDETTVASGQTVTLTWSSQNAMSCTASDGWSGGQALSGSVKSSALTTKTTFTLTCVGSGGSTAQSVTVSIDPPSKGGGGAMGETSLLFLALFVLLRSLRHHMEFRRAAVCAIACAALVACGGAQGRFASYLQRGKEYLEQGNLDKASIELRNALQIQPKSVEALYWNGRVAERKGDLRRAVGLYKAVVEAGPGKLDARQRLVRIFLSARVPAEAQKLLESALKTEPDNAELLALRAATRAQLDDRAGAMADADRALKLAPDSEEAVQVRARLYQDGGDTAAAMQLVTSAVGRNPNSLPLREALVQMELSAGEEGKAEEQLRALIKAPPGDLKYRYQLATLLAKGHRLDDAQHVLEDAVKGLPHNDEVKLNLVDFISTLRSSGEGEKVLRGFIAGEPDHYSLRLALGALLQRTGSIPEAIRTYQEVIERDETGPSGLIARTRLASIAASQGRKDDARKLLAEVLQKNPRDNDALTLRAELALVGADPRAAITDLRAVLHDQPEAIGIRRLLARAYVAGGETALAEETLRSALDVAPADTGIRMELAQLDLDARHPDQAVVVLEQGVQKAPANLELREALVKAYVAKQDFAAAHTEAENLKTLRPEAGVGYFLAGQVEQAQQQLPAAQKEFERALQMEPRSFDYLTAVTRVQLARGQREQAIALVKSAAEHDHSNALVLNLLGQLYVGQKNYPSAIDALSRACALAPTWWLPEHNLAMAKSMNGDTAGAITVYEAALRAMPTEPNLIIGLASIREKAGQVDQAIENYEAFYKQNPQAQVVANNLAMLLITYKKDAASLNRALDLTAAFASSSDSTLLDTTGWVHFKRSEYSAALPPLQRAIERTPDSRQIRYHLGMTELRAGQIQRGRSDLEAALAGSANFPGSDEARAALAGLKNEAG